MVPEPDSAIQVHNEAILSRNNEVGTKGKVGVEKRPFDLLECADSVPNDPQTLDEVSNYKMLQMDCGRNMRKVTLRWLLSYSFLVRTEETVLSSVFCGCENVRYAVVFLFK